MFYLNVEVLFLLSPNPYLPIFFFSKWACNYSKLDESTWKGNMIFLNLIKMWT